MKRHDRIDKIVDMSVTVAPLANPDHPFLEIMADALTAKTGKNITIDDVLEMDEDPFNKFSN